MRRGALLALALLPFLLGGCIYQNKCGYSTKLYDEKKSYYDSQGNYIEECPNNVVNYGEKNIEPGHIDEMMDGIE